MEKSKNFLSLDDFEKGRNLLHKSYDTDVIEKGGPGSGPHKGARPKEGHETDEDYHYNEHARHSKRFNHNSEVANSTNKEISQKLKNEAKEKADYHAELRDYHGSEYRRLRSGKIQKSDVIEKAEKANHKYLRKEGDRYIYHESYQSTKGGKYHHHDMMEQHHARKFNESKNKLTDALEHYHEGRETEDNVDDLLKEVKHHATKSSEHRAERIVAANKIKDGESDKQIDSDWEEARRIRDEHRTEGISPETYAKSYHEHKTKKEAEKKKAEKTKSPPIDYVKFINHINKEMSWNNGKLVKEKDGSFTYTGMPGNHLGKELKEAAKNFADINISVVGRSGQTYTHDVGDDEHEYHIKIK